MLQTNGTPKKEEIVLKLQYSIAGVRVALVSDFPLTDSASWQLFADNSPASVDFTYLLTRAPLLPSRSWAWSRPGKTLWTLSQE